jgi:hypothetical protein
MQRHELAQLALDAALHGLPEPEVPWRTQLPAKPFYLGRDGRGYLSTGRSANIETMAVAAWLMFVAAGIAPRKERAAAIRAASDLLLANRACFMLNEFGSTTYSGWPLIAWGVAARAAELLGETALSLGFRELLTQWFALARASMAPCPADGLHVGVEYTGKSGSREVLDESKSAGKMVVTICGERSWGHGHGLGYVHHTLARIAFSMEQPKPVRQLPDPGRLDCWQERALARLAPLFITCAAPAMKRFAVADWPGIVALLKYPTAQPCELRLYGDGSRVFIEGGDEPEPADEDDNSNTPRIALMAVYRTPPRILSLPAWPAPNTGDTRIRQTAVWSDVDRDVHGGGWVLLHSEIGVERNSDGKWVSKAPDPTAPLLARITSFGGGGWVLTGPRAEPPITPAGPAGAAGEGARGRRRRRRPFWRRLLGLDKED